MNLLEKIEYKIFKIRQKIFGFFQSVFKYKATCIICKNKHERRSGWAHILNPICVECDKKMEKQVEEIME